MNYSLQSRGARWPAEATVLGERRNVDREGGLRRLTTVNAIENGVVLRARVREGEPRFAYAVARHWQDAWA
jgi:hypothetical protein